jgi:hypothetical protein
MASAGPNEPLPEAGGGRRRRRGDPVIPAGNALPNPVEEEAGQAPPLPPPLSDFEREPPVETRGRRARREPAVQVEPVRSSRRQRGEAPEVEAEEAPPAEEAEEQAEEAEEAEEQANAPGEDREEGPPPTALSFVASLLKRSIDFLKEDVYEADYKQEHGQGTEPYNTIKQIYETVKENPKDIEVVEQAQQQITELKDQFEEIGCASDLKVALKPICKNVQASLYLFLHDTATEINQALQAAREAEHPELSGFGNAYGAGNEQDEGAAPNYEDGREIQEQAREAYRRLGRQEQRANNAEARRNDLQRQLEEAQAQQRRGGEPPEE